MSASAGIIRYQRKDGTEGTAEIEPNTRWQVPADCVAVTGWDWPPAGGGFGGGGGPYGYAQGPDVEQGRTWSGTVGGGGGTREPCEEEEDDGQRECCGTSRLAYHAEDCRLSRTMRDEAVTVRTDDQVNASYARLRPDGKVTRTVEVSDSVMVDVDADGRPVGVETLDGSDWTGALPTLAIRGRLRIT